jgi:hypothetical protein
VEWLKCRAHANRWKEEVQLVEEEMRRALDFSRWLSCWWIQQATVRTVITGNLQEGLIAYAAEMADMENCHSNSWRRTWQSIRERAELVLKKYLNNKVGEEVIHIPKMTVEIDIEDRQELYNNFSDTEY